MLLLDHQRSARVRVLTIVISMWLLVAPAVRAGPATALEPPPTRLEPPVGGELIGTFEPPHRHGVAFASVAGLRVDAPAAGVVTFAGDVAFFKWVTIATGAELVTVGPLESLAVGAAGTVATGQIVGRAKGDIVLLTVRVGGDYVDPAPYLSAKSPSDGAGSYGRPRLIPESTVPRGSPNAAGAPVPDHPEPPSGASAPSYVAFGDSVTTGFSVATCAVDRAQPSGCAGTAPATAYPDYLAAWLGVDHERVGIWGYTAREASTRSPEPSGIVPLERVESAQRLVTGALGVNDLRFSDVPFWIKHALMGDLHKAAKGRVAGARPDLDAVDASLVRAKAGGARVIVPLYYNPYDTNRCVMIRGIAQTIVDTLDDELARRATANGIETVDLRPVFAGHGSGAPTPFVFGHDCTVDFVLRFRPISIICPFCALVQTAVELVLDADKDFDPHPNRRGQLAIAGAIHEQLRKG